MNSKAKLTLENVEPGLINADLEFTFSNGEGFKMRYLLPKPFAGQPSLTIQQIEELMLRRTIDAAQRMLSDRADKAESAL